MGNSNKKEARTRQEVVRSKPDLPRFIGKDATVSQINQIKELGEQEFNIYNEMLDSAKNVEISYKNGGCGCHFEFSVVLSSLTFRIAGRDHYEIADNFIKAIGYARDNKKSTDGELLSIEVYYNNYHMNKIDYIEGKKKCGIANTVE